MANKGSASGAAKQVIGLTRGYVFDIMQNDREKVYDRIRQAILDDPIRALKDLSWAFPKEMLIDVDHQVSIDTSMLPPELIREVFSGQGNTDIPAQGLPEGDTVDAPAGAAVIGLPQPG